MLKKILLTVAGSCLLLASALHADHHRYVTAMKAIAGGMKPTNVALGSGDMATVKANAEGLASNFAVLAGWWEGRGSDAAAKLADEAKGAAEALGKAAAANNADGAKAAMGTLGGTCKSCHTAHRVKNADDSWGFKN